MIVEFADSFTRDFKKLKDRDVGAKVAALVDAARDAKLLSELGDISQITDFQDC
jgi:hypothetical protein